MILGTAAYMSPEQARGSNNVDKRADIWSFGVVLYEMVAGKRLFHGDTISDTLASVLKEQPDLGRAPLKVRRLLESCLEKDPKRRLRDIADARRLIDDLPAPPFPPRPFPPRPFPPRPFPPRPFLSRDQRERFMPPPFSPSPQPPFPSSTSAKSRPSHG